MNQIVNYSAYDAQAAMGFVTNQRAHVETAVNETIYPDIQYPELIPVDNSAHPLAQTVEYMTSDKYGQAGWISGGANDMPLAGTSRGKQKTSVYMAGIGYGYTWEEIQVAQQLGVDLTNDDAMAARRAYEEFVDRVALLGDADKGFQSFVDNANVPVVSATNGNWATATDDQILQDVNDLILGVATSTLYTSISDTLLLSDERWNLLATRRLGDTQMTLLRFLMQNNTYTIRTGQPLLMRTVRGLSTAGAGGTQRMIAYRNSAQVVKLHIPMPHRFLPVFQQSPLEFVVPGVFRMGGTDVRRPLEVRYGDGI